MRRPLLAVVAVAALALALAVPAGASSARSADAAARARAAEHKRIVDYWTPARRASAVPRDVVLQGSRPETRAKGGKPGKPGGGGGGGGTSTYVLGAPWTAGGSVAATTGKVFFTSGGVRYVCSGSVVDSSTDNMVLTAGHCAHDGGAGGEYVTNWIFYPRWNSGRDPFLGGWTAADGDLFATANWTSKNSAYADDAAFALVSGADPTVSLETAVRGAGGTIPTVSYGTPSRDSLVHAFGYPAAGAYNGTTLTYCSGPVALNYDGRTSQSIPCDMTGGSSGGPWYQQFGSNGAGGTINSLNSYGYSSIKNRMFGPIFDATQEGGAFDAAQSAG